jgi:hypothetical protein
MLDVPVSLHPASTNKVVVSMKSPEGKANSLVLSFDSAGKFVNSNVLKGTHVGAAYFATGCKNSDDLIVLEQECSELAGHDCRKFGRQVHRWIGSRAFDI